MTAVALRCFESLSTHRVANGQFVVAPTARYLSDLLEIRLNGYVDDVPNMSTSNEGAAAMGKD
jgi:hypothetical protein